MLGWSWADGGEAREAISSIGGARLGYRREFPHRELLRQMGLDIRRGAPQLGRRQTARTCLRGGSGRPHSA